MRTRGRLWVGAVAIALTACALAPGEVSAATCTTRNCFVSVTITNDKIDAPNPDPVSIKGRGHVIHWEIKTPGYVFPDDGIVVKDDTGHEFDGGHTAEQGKKFQLNDKNTLKKTYKYTIKVLKGSTPLTPLDPAIANDP